MNTTQHWRFAHTETHGPVRWITQRGIGPHFYQHSFRTFTITHRRWIPEQLCGLSQGSASSTFRSPHTVTYFIRTDVFQLLEYLWDIHFWIVFSGNLFLCIWVLPALVRQCVNERKTGMFKRQKDYEPMSCRNCVSYCCHSLKTALL